MLIIRAKRNLYKIFVFFLTFWATKVMAQSMDELTWYGTPNDINTLPDADPAKFEFFTKPIIAVISVVVIGMIGLVYLFLKRKRFKKNIEE
jgi:hypothetical protein